VAVEIRDGRRADIAAVLELWGNGGVPSLGFDEAGLSALLERDPQALLVALADGLLVGSLIAAWDGWRGSFYRLVVRPELRRRGLGSELLRAGERRLAARGARRLTAIVDPDDPIAAGFWQAAGYGRQLDRARFVRGAAEQAE
jgi:ribosomal protein S18 acetylase RimI-like enzyme